VSIALDRDTGRDTGRDTEPPSLELPPNYLSAPSNSLPRLNWEIITEKFNAITSNTREIKSTIITKQQT